MMKKISFALLLTASSTALAQLNGGSITFSPESIGIPIFGGAGIALLGLLMGGLAFIMRRKGTHLFAISALAVGGLVATLSGAHIIEDTIAGGSTDITNPNGDNTFPLYDMVQDFNNVSGVNMIVTDIQSPVCLKPAKFVTPRNVLPTCELGRSVPDGTSCTINPCFDLPLPDPN